jgi:putative nucleic acid modification protein with dual OB domain
MRIVVTDLTRMQRGYVCVAGVEPERRQHVRPVLATGRLSKNLLACHGGPFDLATMVDLGATEPVPMKPEVEDHQFSARNAKSVEMVDSAEFWDLLTSLARPKLRTIFGPELRRRGTGAAVGAEAGAASLGCLRPAGGPELYVRPRAGGQDQVRMRLSDGDFDLAVSVTDVRLYGNDHITPDAPTVQGISEQIAGGTGVLLSVGLTRPFAATPDLPPVHWLQVNNIHLESDPAWRLGSAPWFVRLFRAIFGP